MPTKVVILNEGYEPKPANQMYIQRKASQKQGHMLHFPDAP